MFCIVQRLRSAKESRLCLNSRIVCANLPTLISSASSRPKRKNISPFRNKLELDCDPPSDQNDVIIRQPEEVADVYGVTLHRDIQSFLQFCQSSCILARDD